MSEQIKVGLIGGSGLGAALTAQTSGRRHEIDTPFGRPSDAIVETEWAGVPVFFLSRHGPGHLLNPSQIPYRANLFALKSLGCTHIIASGAVGSLREEYRPRDIVIPDQLIDKTFRRAGTFFDRAAVHVEFAEPFCPLLRQILIDAGEAAVIGEPSRPDPADGTSPANATPEVADNDSPTPAFLVHTGGCCVVMEGPAFSCRAESLMHRLWGGDLIGMTTLPEARLAREAEMAYALVALVTDYDCWRQKPLTAEQVGQESVDPSVLLKEIIANLESATANTIRLIQKAVELMSARREQLSRSPALHALELAIWSDKSKISPEEVQRLGPLWLKYFEATKAQG
jgi:5'-methylthioadenosine phosphorylase